MYYQNVTKMIRKITDKLHNRSGSRFWRRIRIAFQWRLTSKKKTIMAEAEDVPPVYFAISNIPVAFRSADLRNYFSQFIESGGFHCFHYRHRPEVLREPEGPENTATDDGEEGNSKSPETHRATKEKQSCCCIVSVCGKDAERFIRMYAGNHWIDSKGNWLARRCVIKRIKVSNDKG